MNKAAAIVALLCEFDSTQLARLHSVIRGEKHGRAN